MRLQFFLVQSGLATSPITYPPRSRLDRTRPARVPRPAYLNRPWDPVPRPLLRAASLLACILPKNHPCERKQSELGLGGEGWSVVGETGVPRPHLPQNMTSPTVPMAKPGGGTCGLRSGRRGVSTLHPHSGGPARIVKRLGCWLGIFRCPGRR